MLDTVEWFSGYAMMVGLIAVDRAAFVRMPTPIMAWSGGGAKRNGVA